MKKKIIVLLVIVIAVIAAYVYQKQQRETAAFRAKFASGNGRIEATEIYITSKIAGRIESIKVNRGDLVKEGDVLVQMDVKSMLADKVSREAKRDSLKAQKLQLTAAKSSALAQVEMAKSKIQMSEATLKQKESTLVADKSRYERTKDLFDKKVKTQQQLEDDKATYLASEAVVVASKANLAESKASLLVAEADVKAAEANLTAIDAEIASAQANIDSLDVDIQDATLRAPRPGRIQYNLAQVSEVVTAGGRVLNLADLTDVFMEFFLPAGQAGQLKIGAEARIVLDALPQYPVSAKVSYVASTAQFTPKTVETEQEREKMMFRVEAKISPELLMQYIDYVKTGMPGVAYVKMDESAEWPEFLQIKKD